MTTLLEVRDLSVSYGKVEAVHKVSITVDEGAIVTVIGPNGAGKTTLLAAIMGTLASRGDIQYLGEAVGSLSVEQRVGSGLVLVPEKREERTTEGGLAVVGDAAPLTVAIAKLRGKGIRVSLFVDPIRKEIEASRAVGAEVVELHTGEYCNAPRDGAARELDRLREAAAIAADLGLDVAAGHGLHYHNVRPVSEIPEVEELNIGHSIIARAVFVGLEHAVRQMREAMGEP